jgi:hypothetical protein
MKFFRYFLVNEFMCDFIEIHNADGGLNISLNSESNLIYDFLL